MSLAARALVSLVAAASIQIPQAQAHTLGNRHVSQLLEIELTPAGVMLRLTVDAPPEQWAAYGGGADPVKASLARLHQGLLVSVDEVTVPARVVDARPIWDLASGASILQVVVEADADLRGRHTYRVSNTNLSDTPNYLNDELTLPPGSQVHATSLLRKTATGAVADRSGMWAQYEALRSVTIDATLPTDPASRAFAAAHGGVWRLDEARERPLTELWTSRRDTPTTVLVAGFAAALLGAAGARLTAVRWLGLAVLLPAAAWSFATCAPAFRGIVLAAWLLGALAGAASGRRARPHAAWLYVPGAVAAAVAVARLIG